MEERVVTLEGQIRGERERVKELEGVLEREQISGRQLVARNEELNKIVSRYKVYEDSHN
jgi:hypothetical protein